MLLLIIYNEQPHYRVTGLNVSVVGCCCLERSALFTSLGSSVPTVASCNRLSCTELWPESVGMLFDAHGLGPNALMFICMEMKLSVVFLHL